MLAVEALAISSPSPCLSPSQHRHARTAPTLQHRSLSASPHYAATAAAPSPSSAGGRRRPLNSIHGFHDLNDSHTSWPTISELVLDSRIIQNISSVGAGQGNKNFNFNDFSIYVDGGENCISFRGVSLPRTSFGRNAAFLGDGVPRRQKVSTWSEHYSDLFWWFCFSMYLYNQRGTSHGYVVQLYTHPCSEGTADITA